MAISLSLAKSIIRSARESVRSMGAVGGESPWVGWLVDSDWWGCADYEVGSVEEQGWAGMWVIDQAAIDSEHRLFRELRDPAVTCVVITQCDQGFIRGYVSASPRNVVEAELDADFGPRCSECGDALGDVYFEHDDMVFCSECANECESCGCVLLRDDGFTPVVDDDTGAMGFFCGACMDEIFAEVV